MGLLAKCGYYSARIGITEYGLLWFGIDQHDIIILQTRYSPTAVTWSRALGPALRWGDAAVPSLKDHSRTAIPLRSFPAAANSYRAF